MKWKLAVLLALALASASCRNDKGMRREQKNYDVVQEGSATGVSSTISGPGETPPPATASYPMTATNADTTTAFTLPSTPVESMQQPSTIAGTVPQPVMIRPRPKPVHHEESGTTMATDTVAVQTQTTAPEQTETAATTTDTAPPPSEEPRKKKKDQEQQPPPPPPTDTTTTTNPPR